MLKFKDLKNNTARIFVDISSEEYRTYIFDKEKRVTIMLPIALSVSNNGHFILDSEGISHYIPKGWIHLFWRSFINSPHFVE